MKKKKDIIKLIIEYNELNEDVDRFKFLYLNKDVFELFLDNDYTYIKLSSFAKNFFTDEELDECGMYSFDDYLGNSMGVKSLLDSLGISYEVV